MACSVPGQYTGCVETGVRKIAITRSQITPRRIFAALLISAAVMVGTGCASHLSPNVSRLIQELKSPDLRRRSDAAVELERVQPLPPEAIEALADAVEAEEAVQSAEPGDGFQLFAFRALSTAGTPAIPAITALTKSQNPLTSTRAVEALGRIGLHDPTVWPILIGAFTGSSPHAAAQKLSEIGPPVLPLLRESLKDDDPRVRAGAAEALREMATLSRLLKGTPSLGIVLADPADLAPAAPALADALNDPDSNVRNQAAIALAWVAPTDNRSVPILVQLLEGKDSPLSNTSFLALQSMGSGAKDAFPTLERVLTSNPVPLVRVEAAYAVASSAGGAACTPLAQALADDKNGDVRTAAICAMARLRPACPQALPALIGTLGQKQFWAIDALTKLGPSAVPALTTALKSSDSNVREDAVKALAQMKPLSPEAVQALMLALKDVSLDVRSAAATALQDVGGAAEDAVLAEQNREEKLNAQQSKPDTHRYSKDKLSATIPADADHKYPLTLAYLLPIYPRGGFAQQAEFLITLHSGKDRPERLVFWKKVGDDQYQQAKVIEPEGPDFAEVHFETPNVFFPKGQVPGLPGVLLVDVPMDGYRSHSDQVFALDGGELRPVEIESPDKWYKGKLGPRETVWYPARNSFGDDKLEFAFGIWNADDPIASPTAGQVTGTYRIVKETGGAAAPALGAYSPVTGETIISYPPKTPTTTWKMVVDTAERESIPRSAYLPHASKDTRNVPSGKKP